MTVLYPNPCYNKVCYKGIALYISRYPMWSKTMVYFVVIDGRLQPPTDGKRRNYQVDRTEIQRCKGIIEPQHLISNNVAFWQVKTQTSLCSIHLSLETPNGLQ